MSFSSPQDGGHALDLSAGEACGLPVFGVAVHYPAGHVVPLHHHPYGHVIYADRGLLRVEAESGQPDCRPRRQSGCGRGWHTG